MGISVNGPSGIDTASIIEQLVELEYTNKVDPQEEKKDAYELEISAYSQMSSLVADLSSKAAALNSISDFDLFTTSSSDEDVATISGSTGCQTGTYSLEVYHMATSEKLVSTDKLISSQSVALSSLGISTGTFSINGVEVSIDDDDTLQDLRMKINGATGSDGDGPGVSASVLKLSDSNYRLVLTAEDSGSAGAEYRDVSGSVLQDLGIIMSADGDKEITSQQLQSDGSVEDDFSGLSAGSVIVLSGKDHDGNAVSSRITKTDSMTDEDFLQEIEDAFHGTVSASFGSDGTLTVTDAIAGKSSLTFGFDSFGGTSSVPSMTYTDYGDAGKNVISSGSNAFIGLDGLYLQSESDEVDGVISGATISLGGTTGGKAVTLSIERDTDAVADKISAFVDSYNTLYNWMDEQTSFGETDSESDDSSSDDGALAGDMTARSIMNTVSSVFREQFTSVSGKYKNLFSIGISIDYTSGEYTLDTTKLDKALSTNFNDVVNLFVSGGSSDTSGISLGLSSSKTKSGTYEIEKTDTGYRMRLEGSTEWTNSSSVVGDIVSFTEGPVNGLSLTISSGTLTTGETAKFTYSKGFGDRLSETADSLTKNATSGKGLIAMRQESLTNRISDIDDRVDTLTTQIENYRERLTKQYAAMEQALNTLQTQMSNMLSQLGTSSSSS